MLLLGVQEISAENVLKLQQVRVCMTFGGKDGAMLTVFGVIR
jgi:hypothetical protein